MRDKIKIFLAHASEDKELVKLIYSKLKNYGFNPWLDEIDLVPGQNWEYEIPRAIQDSDIFLACLSKLSVLKQGYVQKEFRLALNFYAEKPPGSVYLIPVRLDDCKVPELQIPQLGVSFAQIQWLDFWKEDGFEKLVSVIERSVQIKAQSPDNETKDISEEEVYSERFGNHYYTRLRRLLVSQDWEAADEETNDRMCEVVDRLQYGGLGTKDFKKFPCLDLCNINNLWVKYSKGKFGFSIQQKIWQNCGEPKRENDDWKKFAETVEWKNQVNWISNILDPVAGWKSGKDLTYINNAIIGHLPFKVITMNHTVVYSSADVHEKRLPAVELFAPLMKRLKSCELL